jgi:pyruvate formate lyase activating enzyme
MKGLIFSIKRYSVHDGPGIRVTFFMKGCPLNCIWCHNPEGISPLTEKVFRTNKVGGKSFSTEVEVGKYYTVKEVIDILDKERVFISKSGGGVTFSGGEPLLQFDFLKEALKACKTNGYHTAVDTAGYSSSDNYRAIIPFTDIFLFDIKHLDDARHVEMTGVSNRMILENCRMLLEYSKEIIFRIPVIPGINDDDSHMERMKKFINDSKTSAFNKINLLPYHKTGSSKYTRFNRPFRMEGVEPPSKEKMRLLKELFSETGVKVKIGG